MGIWLAYLLIPCALIYFVRRRRDVAFSWMFWMFGAFIVGCGTTHLMEVITTFEPLYRLAGLIKLLTAGISLATAAALFPLLPRALALRSPRELEGEIERRNRVEESLRQSETRFRLLVESAEGYAIYMLDLEGNVVSWNAGAQRMMGYRAEDILGQNFSRCYPTEAAQAGVPQQALAKAAASGRAEEEGWRQREDGSRFWANIIITALRDNAGYVWGFSKIVRDLTESKRIESALRDSEERFRALTQSANDAIISADAAGAIIFWNHGAEALFGYSPEEVLGRPVTMLMPESYRDAHRHGIARFQETGIARIVGSTVELHGLRKDGTEFPIELSLAAWKAGERTYFGTIIRDITRRKRAEEKLEAFAQQLQRSNDELDQFASVASHDLQEPLRKIQSFGDRLEKKCAEALTDQGRDYLERMLSSVVRMRSLIDDLLAFSRVTSKAHPFKRVDLGRVAHDAIADLEGLVHITGGQVQVGELPKIDADPTQMRQLFQNLVGNALKFHRPDTPPHVRIEGRILEAPQELGGDNAVGPMCEVRVIDNGMGFDETYLDRIFEVFQRLHGRTEIEGTGMGLPICRKIVQRHHGSITARSSPGMGATFIVLLPVVQREEDPDNEDTHQADHAAHGR